MLGIGQFAEILFPPPVRDESEKKMNILIVTGIFPPDHGGPASYVPAIARALHSRGHRIVGVVTLSDRIDNNDEQYFFPVVRIRRYQSKCLRRLSTVATIRGLSRHADVVYLNGLVFEGIVACKIIGSCPVAIKVVGDLIWERTQNEEASISIGEFQRRYLGFRIEALKRLQAWYTKRADAIVVPSGFLKKIVQGWGISPERIRVIHNAIDTYSGRYPVQQFSHCDVVSVGRLIPLKRMDSLISVCIHNNWSLRIVGDGPSRTALEKIVQDLGGESLVSFTGYLSKDAVRSAIRAGKVFVLNSIHEGFPHVILEAKQVGVPVVACHVGGIPELINHLVDGVLIPPNDDSALSNAIHALLGDSPLRESLIEAAKVQVQNLFSWEALVVQTEDILKETSNVGSDG